jgi:hypothetical protein
MRGKQARQPPALTHGLTSRWLFEVLEEDVAELAKELMGSAPHEPVVAEAARKAAEAILRLGHVKAMKAFAFREAEPGRQASLRIAEWARAFASKGGVLGASGRRIVAKSRSDGKAGSPSNLAMLRLMETSGALLRRIDDYERRALSQRSKAIRELDHARIDAARRAPG